MNLGILPPWATFAQTLASLGMQVHSITARTKSSPVELPLVNSGDSSSSQERYEPDPGALYTEFRGERSVSEGEYDSTGGKHQKMTRPLKMVIAFVMSGACTQSMQWIAGSLGWQKDNPIWGVDSSRFPSLSACLSTSCFLSSLCFTKTVSKKQIAGQLLVTTAVIAVEAYNLSRNYKVDEVVPDVAVAVLVAALFSKGSAHFVNWMFAPQYRAGTFIT